MCNFSLDFFTSCKCDRCQFGDVASSLDVSVDDNVAHIAAVWKAILEV